jgi:chromosome segregation ATPase
LIVSLIHDKFAGQNTETAMLVSSLREVIRKQAEEIESLHKQLKERSSQPEEVIALNHEVLAILKLTEDFQVSNLRKQVAELTAKVSSLEERGKDLEKEQEDLLVLFDEVSSKRKRDKAKLQEAGLDVSEDEAEEDDE